MNASPPSTSLEPLLPPAASDDPAVQQVVERATRVLHDLLDELRTGPLDRAGHTSHQVKDDGSPVTPVDVEVDRRLRAGLTATFPSHHVVSEELDATASGAEWQWVVDPVDGTSNFAAGLHHWGVALALCHGGIPVLGVVDAPDLRQRWVGVRDGPCRRDGVEVSVRRGVSMNDPHTAHLPLLTTLGLLGRVRRPARVRLNPRVLGATAVDGALVADGTAVAAATTSARVWDVAAPAVLVEAAGGAAIAMAAPVFPLVAGRDHADRRVPTIFGPSHAFLDELVDRLTPAGGSLVSP